MEESLSLFIQFLRQNEEILRIPIAFSTPTRIYLGEFELVNDIVINILDNSDSDGMSVVEHVAIPLIVLDKEKPSPLTLMLGSVSIDIVFEACEFRRDTSDSKLSESKFEHCVEGYDRLQTSIRSPRASFELSLLSIYKMAKFAIGDALRGRQQTILGAIRAIKLVVQYWLNSTGSIAVAIVEFNEGTLEKLDNLLTYAFESVDATTSRLVRAFARAVGYFLQAVRQRIRSEASSITPAIALSFKLLHPMLRVGFTITKPILVRLGKIAEPYLHLLLLRAHTFIASSADAESSMGELADQLVDELHQIITSNYP